MDLTVCVTLTAFTITALVLYKLFTTPTRFVLQTLILIPILFITSVLCTLIGGIIKYLSFNLVPKAYKIYILQEIYKSFGEVEWFSFEFWTNLRYVVSSEDMDAIETDVSELSNLNTILLGNHSESLFDFIPLGSICDKMNRVSASFCFIKKEIRWYPIMGWLEAIAPHGVTLERNWNKDKIAIAQLCDRFNANHDFKLVTPWMWFIFPEGTRFSQKKLIEAQQFAQDRGYPVYNHLLQPRVKGFSYLTHHLHKSLDCIIDATILYKPTVPTPKDVFVYTRMCKYIHIHLRVYKQQDIPQSINELDQWLRDRWTEKDLILQKMKHGEIAYKTFERSPWRAIKYYTFYAICSTYLVFHLFAGYAISSTPFMTALICAFLPLVVVSIEHKQESKLKNK